jgi:NADPH:quinone reductase-like Zn-dependent oxidoreductase
MRALFPLAVLLIAQAGAAWAVGEANTARPGATYSTTAADDAAACEQLCADDTICMAWSFRENSCDLKATVPSSVAQGGATSGVSTRARAFLRARYEAPAAAASTPATAAEAVLEADGPAPIANPEEDDVSLALLGGPEPEDLRNRLGN